MTKYFIEKTSLVKLVAINTTSLQKGRIRMVLVIADSSILILSCIMSR